jgi:hypothetical protein
MSTKTFDFKERIKFIGSWSELKNLINGMSASLAWNWTENDDLSYYQIITEQYLGLNNVFWMQRTGSLDQTDFETNWKNAPLRPNNYFSLGLVGSGSVSPVSGTITGGKDALGKFQMFAVDPSGRLFITGSVAISGSNNGVRITDGANPIDSNDGITPITSASIMIGGYDSTNGKARRLSVDSQGRLVTAPAGSNTTTNGFADGMVTTAAVTNVPIRFSTYNEPTSSAQRSISSANAADTNAAGTGARQVTITYYDLTGSGPKSEIVSLNGTTTVNTVNSNICYIENIVVSSVGSTGNNVGIITLFGGTGGVGGTVATINATNNQTYWAHHYVGNTKTCYVTSISGHNNNSSNGVILSIQAKTPLTSSTVPSRVVSDFVRAGGGTAQTTRLYGTPIAVVGPARLILYGQPEGTPSIVHRASFDYYDQ